MRILLLLLAVLPAAGCSNAASPQPTSTAASAQHTVLLTASGSCALVDAYTGTCAD